MLHARNYRYDTRGGILRINKIGLYTVYLYKRVFGAWESNSDICIMYMYKLN
jgi:hypothetical protein